MSSSELNKEILSVSVALQKAKELLEHQFSSIAVMGEISDYKFHPSGHIYFSLKDAKSVLRCTFFRTYNQALPFKLNNGMNIIAMGSLSLYPAKGNFQLNVYTIEPVGIGSLQIAFEQLWKKLNEEGLFSADRKRTIPKFPQKIVVVTSPSGAARHDFITTIESRMIETVDFKFVNVQGQDAIPEIIHAIETISNDKKYDVLFLTRGGGSAEELSIFNDEKLVRTLANCSIPTVSAIGHEVDKTLCDYVADLRVATPTAAAGIIPARQQVRKDIHTQFQKIKYFSETAVQTAHQNFLDLEKRFKQINLPSKFDLLRQSTDETAEELIDLFKSRIEDFREKISAHRNNLNICSPRLHFEIMKNKLNDFQKSCQKSFQNLLKEKHLLLHSMSKQINNFHPFKPLKRGYAFVKMKRTHKIISSTKKINKKDIISVQVFDGQFDAEVISIDEKKE
jgi:exodeoxyribonuclease VII large subunit